MGVHIAMHAMQCVNVEVVWECTWPQSILHQDSLTGHPTPPTWGILSHQQLDLPK